MIQAATNYLQSNCFQSFRETLARIRKLPESVVRNRRVALICARDTAKAAVGKAAGPVPRDRDDNIVRVVGESLDLPAEMCRSGFQRLRAGSVPALVIGTFDGHQTSVTGSLAMLLQHYGLRRDRAARYEASVAAGEVLVCVSCEELPGDVCEAVYETLTHDTSHQQTRFAAS